MSEFRVLDTAYERQVALNPWTPRQPDQVVPMARHVDRLAQATRARDMLHGAIAGKEPTSSQGRSTSSSSMRPTSLHRLA